MGKGSAPSSGRAAQSWWAPGRVNLIGEHTDYNGGLALPFAIDRGTTVTAAPGVDGMVAVRSSARPGVVEVAVAVLAAGVPPRVPGWARHPLGVAWALLADGVDLSGADLAIDSDLPIGAGLSSSASLEVATTCALTAMVGADLGPGRLVAACHRAETEAVGAPVGLLDHLAVVHAQRGHATLIDFALLEVTPVPLAIGPLVVVDTGVRHDTAAAGYRTRRAECAQAATLLGVARLRNAGAEQVERLDDPFRRRARHVVGEDRRVAEVAARLRSGEDIGALLVESHASLRDDFEVSCPELDLVVEVALAAGASGARLTGAGFGGCAVVLGAAPGRLADELGVAFARRGWAAPAAFPVAPGGGPLRIG